MKKFLRIAGLSLLVLFLLILLLPFLFRGKIADVVQKSLDEKIDAKVLFNPDDLSLSLISSFPDFKVSIRNFGIINKAPFEGDTLFYAEEFGLGLDILSVVSGDQIRIRKVFLENAGINVFVLADGQANYNISKPGKEADKAEPESAAAYSLKVDSWEIKNLNLNYADAGSGTMAAILGLEHSGSGDFSQDIVDIQSKTKISDLSLTMDSVNYLRHRKFASEMNFKFNQKEKSISFGENFVELNAFRIAFQGDAAFGGEKPKMNLQFNSPESDLKSLISLIPVVFAKDFEQVNANGKFSFEGHVRGTYDSLSLPDFSLKLNLGNGSVQYPKLPQKIEKLNLDLSISHPQGSLELLKTDLRRFSMQLGKNPIEASGQTEGLSNPLVNLKLKGQMNLAELTAAFPIEGMTLKGILSLDLGAKGRYNAATKEFPVMAANLKLTNGYAKSADFPKPIENIHCEMSALNTNGQASGTSAEIKQLGFILEDEPFEMSAALRDLDDLKYQVKAKGTVDLGRITKIFPVDGMSLSGRMKADISASGAMSDVNARRYEKLPTSGTAELTAFTMKSAALSLPVAIEKANLRFDSKELELTGMQMTVGKSDFALSGKLSNHLAWFLRNETLRGNLKMKSNLTDANQLMALSGDEPVPANAKETPPAKAEPLPQNLDVVFSSENGKILYDNMVLENASGTFSMKEGILGMKDLKFRTLDGDFAMNGKYDPRQASQPAFAYSLQMKNVSIPKAYETFSSLRALAPAAKNMEGKLGTDFRLEGKMDEEMNPVLSSLNGAGNISVTGGKMKDFSLLKGINSVAKTSFPTEVALNDLKIKTTIVNGRVNFEPFDVKVAGQVVNIGGSNGLDGSIDYLIKTSVPAGAAGNAVASALSSFSGKSISSPKDVKFEIAATGPGASPKFKIVKVDAGNVKSQAKEAVADKIQAAKAEAEAKARAEAERLKKEAESKAKAETDRLKKEAEDKAKGELEKLKKKFKF